MNNASVTHLRDRLPVAVNVAINGPKPASRAKAKKLPRQTPRHLANDTQAFQPEVALASIGFQNGAFGSPQDNPDRVAEIQENLAGGRVEQAGQLAIDLLDARVAAGDHELNAAKAVIRFCLSLVAMMPPLSHVSGVPLRPDDRLYMFFDQFLSLLRQQDQQMRDLQSMIHELI